MADSLSLTDAWTAYSEAQQAREHAYRQWKYRADRRDRYSFDEQQAFWTAYQRAAKVEAAAQAAYQDAYKHEYPTMEVF